MENAILITLFVINFFLSLRVMKIMNAQYLRMNIGYTTIDGAIFFLLVLTVVGGIVSFVGFLISDEFKKFLNRFAR